MHTTDMETCRLRYDDPPSERYRAADRNTQHGRRIAGSTAANLEARLHKPQDIMHDAHELVPADLPATPRTPSKCPPHPRRRRRISSLPEYPKAPQYNDRQRRGKRPTIQPTGFPTARSSGGEPPVPSRSRLRRNYATRTDTPRRSPPVSVNFSITTYRFNSGNTVTNCRNTLRGCQP